MTGMTGMTGVPGASRAPAMGTSGARAQVQVQAQAQAQAWASPLKRSAVHLRGTWVRHDGWLPRPEAQAQAQARLVWKRGR